MKKLNVLSLILFLALSSSSSFGQTTTSKTKEIKILTSAVCGMCKTTIEKAMAYEKGVKSFSLDVESKVLTVVYNSKKTDPDKIRKAVTEVGYDADDIPAEKKAYDDLNPCCKKGGHL